MTEKASRRDRKKRAEEAAPTAAEPADTDVSVDVKDERDAGGDAAVEAGTETGEATTVTLSADEHARLLEVAREREVFLDELRRARAEFENYQKRVRRERPSWEARALRGFIQDFLPLVDNFERALQVKESSSLETFSEGVRMIYQMVVTTLKDHGVKTVDALGQPFDPTYHEAIAQVETDDAGQDGKVVEVHQKGYLHGDTVIRPARVVVGKRRPEVPDSLDEEVEPPEDASGEAPPQ